MARLALIVVVACVFIFLVSSYNNNNNGNNTLNNTAENDVNNQMENFYAEGEETEEAPNANAGETESEAEQEPVSEGEESDPMPSEGENNEVFKNVDYQSEEEEAKPNNEQNNSNRLPNECYPKDTLTPKDLLPQDSNSTWAQTVPSGQGSLGDQNFLNAGFHVGINTVGQSLRNANLQLRSEPANPQVKVSPWLQTTIEPDTNRRAMEIGA